MSWVKRIHKNKRRNTKETIEIKGTGSILRTIAKSGSHEKLGRSESGNRQKRGIRVVLGVALDGIQLQSHFRVFLGSFLFPPHKSENRKMRDTERERREEVGQETKAQPRKERHTGMPLVIHQRNSHMIFECDKILLS